MNNLMDMRAMMAAKNQAQMIPEVQQPTPMPRTIPEMTARAPTPSPQRPQPAQSNSRVSPPMGKPNGMQRQPNMNVRPRKTAVPMGKGGMPDWMGPLQNQPRLPDQWFSPMTPYPSDQLGGGWGGTFNGSPGELNTLPLIIDKPQDMAAMYELFSKGFGGKNGIL